MIQVSEPATILYAYGNAGISSVDVLYAYNPANVQTNDLDHVYGWGLETDRWDRKSGFWAFTTQELGNLFPRWHAARLNTGGNTQELINAWAMSYDHAKLEFARFRKQLFVDTAELTEPDLFSHASVVDYGADVEKDRTKNFLANPSFAVRGLARRNTPIFWSTWLAKTTGTVQLVDSPVFVGSRAVQMHAEAGEKCYLGQTVPRVVEVGRFLTLSFWYMVPMPEDTVEADERQMGIVLSVIYANGTMDLVRTALDVGTGGKWRRASATIELDHELFSATVSAQIENDTDDDLRVYLGAAQLEVSQTPTPWSESDSSFLPYQNENVVLGAPVDVYVDFGTTETTETIGGAGPVTYFAKTGRSLSLMRNQNALWEDAVPTRATTTLLDEVPDSETFDRFGWFANPERERFNTRWRVTNNLIEQFNADITRETVCMWDIGELHLDEDFRLQVGIATADEFPSFSRTIEALCVHKNKLWVLCLEIENGVTKRVLKVLDPWSRWPIPLAYEQELTSLHLECVGDVDIGMASGSADYLGVLTEDPDTFVMRVGDNYYSIELEFEHFVFDYDRGLVITRNAYSGGELVSL